MKNYQKLISDIQYIEGRKKRVSVGTPTKREDCGTPFVEGDEIYQLLTTLHNEFSIGGTFNHFNLQVPLYSNTNLDTLEVRVLDMPETKNKEKYVVFTMIP
jgi:hypothetical protein